MVITAISLTVQDACLATGLGRTTLYSLIAAGKLDARKSGSRTLVLADSLKRYVSTLAPAVIGIPQLEQR